MSRRSKILIFVAIAGMIVAIVIALALGSGEVAAMAVLQSRGYSTNQAAVFLLTNPGPRAVEFAAHQEWGRTNSFLTNGVLAGHAALLFQIPLSERPTKLVINCSVQRNLRDLADELRSAIGLRVQPRQTEYTLFSEELKK